MFQVNKNYLELPGSYLFSTIAKGVNAYTEAGTDRTIIRLGIGNMTQPIAPTIIKAIHKVVGEVGDAATFHGYTPDLGYAFLREKIAEQDYQAKGREISADGIFVSDGAKCDCGSIQEVFATGNKIAACNPVYPVYVDFNVMAGRISEYDEESGTWNNVIYIPCTVENQLVPELPRGTPGLIYFCISDNPTGMTLTREQLKIWVDYASRVGAAILYDMAYEVYITEENVPHSIYEIEETRTCAIEFRSYSKSASFTGVRLGFTVVPKDLKYGDVAMHNLWVRRHGIKFNGTPYVTRKTAMAVYSQGGKAEIKEQVVYYVGNAKTIYDGLKEAGYQVYGAVSSPYAWLEVPEGMTSWNSFDYLLGEANVVGTPGSGFGPSGGGYFRPTGFGTYENTVMAVERMKALRK